LVPFFWDSYQSCAILQCHAVRASMEKTSSPADCAMASWGKHRAFNMINEYDTPVIKRGNGQSRSNYSILLRDFPSLCLITGV
jgi:hypothetical protein